MGKHSCHWAVGLLLVVSHCLPGFGFSQEVVGEEAPNEETAVASCPTNVVVPGDLPELSKGYRYATPGRYPYMVSLLRPLTRQRFCNGVLVAKDVVLTPAHCVDPEQSNSVLFPLLSIGGIAVSGDGDSEMPEVCSTIIHANFTTTREGFDVALLKLATPSDKTPVNLLYSKLPDGQEVKSLGWPSTLTTISKNLQDFALSVLDREQCGDRIRKDCKCEFQVMDSIVCAQATDKDACTDGIAGSPILVLPSEEDGPKCGEDDILAGILSMGLQCDQAEGIHLQAPNFYTDVTNYTSWIVTLGGGLENRVYDNTEVNGTCAESGN